MVYTEDVEKYRDSAYAMWHTHPRNNVNLSPEDYSLFLRLPRLRQYIVTETRVRSFFVRNGKVYLDEADCL